MGRDALKKRIAVYCGPGSPESAANPIVRACAADDRLSADLVGAVDIQHGKLASFSTVVFPGGSGSAQAQGLESQGRRSVLAFVGSGGGYLGICGGAFLSTAHYSWSLGLLNTRVLTSPPGADGDPREGLWYRGNPADVMIELTTRGQAVLAVPDAKQLVVNFHNGPIFLHDNTPSFETLALYRTEVSRTERQIGTMLDTPAAIAGMFNSGKVIAIGPHIESNPARHGMIANALSWLCRTDG